MITIELVSGGKTKKYKAANVTLRVSYDAYRLYRKYTEAQGDYPEELLEECANLVCRVFGNAFTEQELLDGYHGSAFRLYPGMLNAIIAYSNEQIANFPEPPETAVKTTAKRA